MAGKEKFSIKKSFWDKNAGRYDRFMRKDHAAYEALYRLIRPVVTNKTVLELAAGTGLTAKNIVGEAQTVEATDASPEMIAEARKGCSSRKLHDALLMSVLLSIEQPLQVFDAEAYHNGTVNGGEGLAVEPADILAEPCFVHRPDLFEQDGGFGLETACHYHYMGGQSRFCLSACDRRHNGGGAVLVARMLSL